MWRAPDTFSAKELKEWPTMEEYLPGRWRPARNMPYSSFQLIRRLKIAWDVFRGKKDAVYWDYPR
jgi:hypothetical protein